MKPKVTLTDTCEWMSSTDWKVRIKAEYWQLLIRLCRLSSAIEAYHTGSMKLSDEEFELLNLQRGYMRNYLAMLAMRAEKVGIDLEGENQC